MNLDELLKQKDELERQISNYRNEGRNKAIAQIQVLMAEHGLTAADLTLAKKGGKPASDASRKPVAAKYRDGNGNQWSGRGLKPKWLTAALASGKKLEDFSV